jgi:hypothetical protein
MVGVFRHESLVNRGPVGVPGVDVFAIERDERVADGTKDKRLTRDGSGPCGKYWEARKSLTLLSRDSGGQGADGWKGEGLSMTGVTEEVYIDPRSHVHRTCYHFLASPSCRCFPLHSRPNRHPLSVSCVNDRYGHMHSYDDLYIWSSRSILGRMGGHKGTHLTIPLSIGLKTCCNVVRNQS